MPEITANDVRQGIGIPTEPVREICAYFFGLDTLSPEQRFAKETAWGYKSKCVRLLQKLCSVKERQVRAWGKGLDFEYIPPIRLAQLTILMLRSKLDKAEATVRQREEQIQKMSRTIESLRWQVQELRKSA
jgi:hypothetical protein